MADKNKRVKWLIIIGIILIAGLASIINAFFDDKVDSVGNIPTFTVKRGPLKISITEVGTIKARENIIVKSQLEGSSSIIWLIDEGEEVKEGDLLIELDTANTIESMLDQEVKLKSAEASYLAARDNLEVVKNQIKSNLDQAEVDYNFAKQDLEKYIQGEYPNLLKKTKSKITLAEEELFRAEDEFAWSKKLFEKNFVSQSELEADELTLKKKKLDLEMSENDLELLTEHTYPRRLAQLQSDVDQDKMTLDRTKRKGLADQVQAEASLQSKESDWNRQKAKFDRLSGQIEKAKMYAPVDGVVVYATSVETSSRRGSSKSPLDEGASVRQRQNLIYLPTSSGKNVEVGIEEVDLDKISIGLPVIVTVDPLPGEIFAGRIVSIAPLPDAQAMYMNADLKVYDTVIYLDNNENTKLLRTGMSCIAEIIVEQHEVATYIPVQAVIRIGGKPAVYVVGDNKIEPRKIKIGMSNNRMIRVIEGLEPGEIVSLFPPISQQNVETDDFEAPSDVALESETKSGDKSRERDNSDEGPRSGKGRKGGGGGSRSDEGPDGTGSSEGNLSQGSPSGMPGGMEMSFEMRKTMREKMQSVSPEQRERFKGASQEEREQMLKEFSKMATQDTGGGE